MGNREQNITWRELNPDKSRTYSKKWRTENPEAYRKSYARTNIRAKARSYGLNPDMVEAHVLVHDGCCDICGKIETMKRLAIDHDHATGEFRGMLCQKCNQGLGHFRDNPKVLRMAADYLEKERHEYTA